MDEKHITARECYLAEKTELARLAEIRGAR